MIMSARKSIYLQSPYFIPDQSYINALKMAANSGVEVNLMIPCKPDHPFVYWATFSNAADLLDSGVNVYTYQNGFIHSKILMIDDEVSSIGSANMDFRSFELNLKSMHSSMIGRLRNNCDKLLKKILINLNYLLKKNMINVRYQLNLRKI